MSEEQTKLNGILIEREILEGGEEFEDVTDYGKPLTKDKKKDKGKDAKAAKGGGAKG